MERPELEQLNKEIRGYSYLDMKNKDFRRFELDVAFSRFFELFYIIAEANNDLVEAANENIDLSKWRVSNIDAEYKLKGLLREGHLKNAILKYNSVEDYILQIITFSEGLKIRYKQNNKIREYDCSIIKGEEDFINKCKKINYFNVKKSLKSKNNDIILNIIEKYRNEPTNVRRYANQIKHQSNLNTNIYPKQSREEIELQNGAFIYKSEWIKNNYEDIDELIDLLYKFQPIVVDYVNGIYKMVFDKFNLSKLKIKKTGLFNTEYGMVMKEYYE